MIDANKYRPYLPSFFKINLTEILKLIRHFKGIAFLLYLYYGKYELNQFKICEGIANRNVVTFAILKNVKKRTF